MANDKPKARAPQDHKPKADQAAKPEGFFRIKYGDVTYTVPHPDEIPNAIDRELFSQSRLNIRDVFNEMGRMSLNGGEPAPFMVAAVIFVAMRVAGERVDFTELEDTFDVTKIGLADDEVEAPKA